MTEYRYKDNEIVSLIDDEVNASHSDWQSKIASSRELAHRYYYGELPHAIENNTSDYVSREVFDTVESIKAKLMRTFTSNRNVVRFEPSSEHDVEAADIRTEYTNKLFFDKNPGYRLLSDAFHDGLLSKQCVFKRTWREKKVTVPETFENVPMQQLEAAAMSEQIDSVEITSEQTISQVTQTPYGPAAQPVHVVSGTVYRKEDKSGVEVEVIPPEDVFISQTCTEIDDADFIAVRYDKTRLELIQEGFDPEKVNKINSGDKLNSDTEESARHSIDGSYDFNKHDGKNERAVITVYDAYIWLDMLTPVGEDSRDAQLWHFVVAGNQVLFQEIVDEMPFRFWSPIMIAHKAVGMSAADITMDLQNASSNTVRGMLDNIHRVNAGVRMADLSKLNNPRDFIDNPIGGVIDADMNAQQSINVVPQAPLSPATGNLIALFDQEKEKRTGDTQLGKGLQSQEVITHQNSGDMIDTLINAGNERIMSMARSFAEICLKPLLLDIYRLGYENGQKVMLNVRGQYIEFDPRSVPFSDEVCVDVALTPEYGENRAAQLMQLHGAVVNDPELAKLYTMEERYAKFSQVYDLLGFANYLGDPKDPKIQQRIAQAQAQAQQMQQMQMQLASMEMQLKQAGIQVQQQKVAGDQQLQKERLDLDSATKADAQKLDEREFEWEKRMDVAEYQLERTQKRPVSVN